MIGYNLGMKKWGLLAVALLACLMVPGLLALAQTEDARYFPETGHWVTGDFLAMYNSVPNPQLVFGYPITDAFTDQNGMKIQYFQRVRFELHPELPIEPRVVLTLLGEYLYQVDGPGTVVPTATSMTACRRIPVDGLPVCYAFLDFFDANGGIAQFGFPISEIEIHDGVMVQYFQRARFEWKPDLPSGQRVALTDLGAHYFNLYEDQIWLLPSQEGDNIPFTVISLNARAFARRATMASSGRQFVDIVVQDQNLRPVDNVTVQIIVRFTDGSERLFMVVTNEHGLAEQDFSFNGQPAGIAEIIVVATSDELEDRTITSFGIW